MATKQRVIISVFFALVCLAVFAGWLLTPVPVSACPLLNLTPFPTEATHIPYCTAVIPSTPTSPFPTMGEPPTSAPTSAPTQGWFPCLIDITSTPPVPTQIGCGQTPPAQGSTVTPTPTKTITLTPTITKTNTPTGSIQLLEADISCTSSTMHCTGNVFHTYTNNNTNTVIGHWTATFTNANGSAGSSFRLDIGYKNNSGATRTIYHVIAWRMLTPLGGLYQMQTVSTDSPDKVLKGTPYCCWVGSRSLNSGQTTTLSMIDVSFTNQIQDGSPPNIPQLYPPLTFPCGSVDFPGCATEWWAEYSTTAITCITGVTCPAGTPTPTGTITPTATAGTPSPCYVPTPDVWINPPVYTDGECYVVVPGNNSTLLPDFSWLTTSLGFPSSVAWAAVEVCVRYLSVDAHAFGYDASTLLASGILIFTAFLIIREFRR